MRVLALFVVPAAAFLAPSSQLASPVVMKAVGETAPLNGFDPLKLSAGKTDAQLARLRECELKHGRVAMAAMLGMLVEPVVHPLAKSCYVTQVTDPFKAGWELNFAGKMQIIGFCGGVEFLAWKMKEGDKYRPGDVLGAAYLVPDEDAEAWISYQNKELNNGRLAMMAFTGFVAQYALYGNYDDLLFKPLIK
uniref:Plastid light harvesting protein n=1 Tax=Aureoumbra lagunensis TaxID=44058 RepID=A0A7S3K3Z8_9STRA|mmetsp:Transcript_3406/g.4766  ORF Transcript_3406/g.4766 Transcript_3406/m.4766 type:complete len:192 (-) Transcript_3406:150-725(-)|eukprot:CAMPEP_0197349656 /NCGR_PEP_ID=MMETSP0893-20130614/11332_1 /TAXON_ID=44058 ORGANISM="Aureoumbra lagunensis, Strain CCMP1510" /NCGR_SAMPLE_ID=MMETSP0893 /ASSEMBLY_ACC=CAM_ASM_000539 /LENGTH=191 /DNA_ID=CAMNT_0042861137 /DNA_START=47 /DNA_END=622 /DNA_ORIENTATION=+